MSARAIARAIAFAAATALASFALPARAQPTEGPLPALPPGSKLSPVPADAPPPAQPAQPSAPVASEPASDAPKCEQAFIERVYKATKPSVVRITRPDGGLGTGFVFHTQKHVATALHVVDLGRGVRVEFPGGRTTQAEVVAVDEDHDLAILELDEPADAPPLQPRWNVEIGAPIVAIGNPYGDLARFSRELEGLLNFSVSQGIVSAKSDAYIQTDAVLSPGNSGGPMLTCDGQVIGVADRLLEARIGFGVPVIHLSHLVGKIGQGPYRGHWTGRDAAIGIGWHIDGETASFFGPYLGGSIVGYDRVSLTLRAGLGFAGKGSNTSEPIVERSVTRLWGELVLGYRVLFFPYAFPTYFTIGVGGLFTLDRGEETRLAASLDPPGCLGATPPNCTPGLVSNTTKIRGGGAQPIAQAVLHLGALETSYGFALDVINPEYSIHRVLIGLSF